MLFHMRARNHTNVGIQQLHTIAGQTEGMFRQEISRMVFNIRCCALQTALCNLANPGGDGDDDVYVCGCLGNAGKGLGGSQQLWDWGMLIEIFCTIAELLLLRFKISIDIFKAKCSGTCANWMGVKYWEHENWRLLKILSRGEHIADYFPTYIMKSWTSVLYNLIFLSQFNNKDLPNVFNMNTFG